MTHTSHRIVRKLSSGERFIETPADCWAARLTAWKQDRGQPCPMPIGHLMFTHPAAYDAVLEQEPQPLDLFAAPASWTREIP